MEENKGKKNIFSTFKSPESNWFLTPQTLTISNLVTNPHRLNDLDSNILEEKAYVNIEDESLKLEYKIEDKERVLKDLNGKIKIADKVGNQQDLFSLRIKKQRIEGEVRELYKEYAGKDLPSKLSDGINNIAVVQIKEKCL